VILLATLKLLQRKRVRVREKHLHPFSSDLPSRYLEIKMCKIKCFLLESVLLLCLLHRPWWSLTKQVDHHDDHIDRVSLRLWTVAINGPTVNPPVTYEHGGVWWNDIDTKNSRFVHQRSPAILPIGSSSSNAGRTGDGNEFCLAKYLCS
jgi:hypothetical protein